MPNILQGATKRAFSIAQTPPKVSPPDDKKVLPGSISGHKAEEPSNHISSQLRQYIKIRPKTALI